MPEDRHEPQRALNASIDSHYICLHFHQRKISTSSTTANKLIERSGRIKNPSITQKLLELERSVLFPLSWVVANIPA